MLSRFLDYFLFEYEIEVYPNYTPLEYEMVIAKMKRFWNLLLAKNSYLYADILFQTITFRKNIMQAITCFYNEDLQSGICISFKRNEERNALSEKFESAEVPFGKFMSGENNRINGNTIICLPYYLFHNDKIAELKSKYTQDDHIVKAYDFYRAVKKQRAEFIWREPFSFEVTGGLESIQTKINAEKECFINEFGVRDPYQQLYCLLVLSQPENKGKDIKDELSVVGHAFAFTIKEWGLDILRQDVIKHAVRAAVSAIISRNHSHHIGSHVTPRTSVKDIEKKMVEFKYNLADKNKYSVIGNLKSRLDEYVQKKADFMAEIATEPLTTTISKSFFREVLLYFIQNTLLMDNIGANEGVNYKNQDGKSENRLKIHFLFKGKELNAHFSGGCDAEGGCKSFNHMHLPYTGLCDCDRPKELWLTNPEGEDVTVAWPGPLGEFSFYCFLENFIRNAIKHNYEKLSDNRLLNVYVSVSELEEDDQERHEFYKIEVWEDATDPCKQIPVTIDGKSGTTTLKKHLAELIDSEIVDNHGRPNKGAWGIAEMKIMATLMRGSDDFTSMNSNLNVGCCKRNGEERLIYEFRVMKSKEIAIIAKTSPEADIRIQHRDQGVWWFDSFGKLKDHQTHGHSPATFNIVVIDKHAYTKDKEKINSHSHLLPYRVIIDDQYEESGHCTELLGASKAKIDWDALKNNEANEIISDFWDKWVAWLMKKNEHENPRIDLFLQQEMGEIPTSIWKDEAEKWEKNGKAIKVSVISKKGEIAPNVCNGEIHFVYDRHFKGVDFLTITKEVDSNLKLLKFHEAFDKCSSDFVPIFASSPTSKMIYQLAEAACLNVLIIDERVAEVAYKKILENSNESYKVFYGDSFQRLHVAKGANIFIATHLKIDNGPVSYVHYSTKSKSPRVCVRCTTSSGTSRVNKFKVYWCNGNDCSDCSSAEEIKPAPNALIMHQGITEGLLKKAILCNNKTETFANALTAFLDDLKKHVPYVVIDSGRGIPANLPDTAKFLPFSLIEDYLMKDRMAKFSLTRVLMSIIRKAKK